jgi:hypothetical protein
MQQQRGKRQRHTDSSNPHHPAVPHEKNSQHDHPRGPSSRRGPNDVGRELGYPHPGSAVSAIRLPGGGSSSPRGTVLALTQVPPDTDRRRSLDRWSRTITLWGNGHRGAHGFGSPESVSLAGLALLAFRELVALGPLQWPHTAGTEAIDATTSTPRHDPGLIAAGAPDSQSVVRKWWMLITGQVRYRIEPNTR